MDIKEKHTVAPSRQHFSDAGLAAVGSGFCGQEGLHIDDPFKKIIVVKDAPAPWYTEDGILVISIYDFLLNADSLDL